MGATDQIRSGYRFLFEKHKRPTGVLGSIILFIILVSVFYWSASSYSGELMSLEEIMGKLNMEVGPSSTKEPFPTDLFKKVAGEPKSSTGHSEEDQQTTESLDIGQENLASITFVLTWTDEEDRSRRHTNEPDYFGLAVTGPNGQSGEEPQTANVHGQEGRIEVSVLVNHTFANDGAGKGRWNYTIDCGDCGDQQLWRPSVLVFTDTGNDWSLEVTYEYYQENA